MLLKFLTVAERVTVKKLNTTEYRQYLKLWNEETKPKQENTKDLPKLNQVKCPGPVVLFIHSTYKSTRYRRD